ncbi:hypothetical protein A3C26_01655 [Candidatus Daviesbacteria bacterium RIFCSPHIGHO2_02_FULL_39_12]|uniref:OmpR/PhoB-type domain-containing protein n=2 Tax=Candidatus Daviesiibacteriota TaxID=1752718 RepID=A0A1F5JCN3_9BACT|nr:MAG: hypothetical protein A3C26_01655 [Candidatus Daviesbacteria bacterium RIFCSPHIGHO2_02_FULL_39_12]OGE72880.1 MAG: hypothetical protein A3H40_01895 [Candidatus Daviesbacteria bacterium RIFCSPLOWO2_02_FULL_38_15]
MYNFKEAVLGPDFAKDKLKDFRQLIDRSLSFVVVSMPGVGVSYFLRYLASQNFARFFHIDLYSLASLTQHELYKLILLELGGKDGKKTDEQMLEETGNILKGLSGKYEKIVLIFSRFDQLKKEFNSRFLSNIQSLTNVAPGKLVLIFTAIKPLNELTPDALSGGNLNFYSENYYFTPYSKEDLKKILEIEPGRLTSKENLEKLLDLSCGHNQLLHILLSSQKQQNLLLDQFVKLQLKEFVDYLNYYQRKTLQKIVLGKTVTEVDDYLLNVGMIKNSKFQIPSSKFQTFTPLLSEYIKTNLPVNLPVKESKLFKLLRNKMGSVVSKDEIFAQVWPEKSEDVTGKSDLPTDWALDALIYRLRKHPFMKANNYIIESQKKVGYTLIQT